MTAKDKADFLKKVKMSMIKDHGVPWEVMEAKILEDIENTFDDTRFAKMNREFQVDAAYARREFGDKKPSLVDYLLWSVSFVTKSEYVDW